MQGPVLITGASGFLGRPLVERLRAAGADLITLSRSGGAHAVCDLTDRRAITGLVTSLRPRTVFHLAARVTAQQDPALLLPMFDANLAATVNLLDAMRAAGGGHLIFAGSIEEGSAASPPASPYGISKLCAALYARHYGAHAGLAVTEARLHLGYGPGQDPAKLIPYLLTQLRDGLSPTLRSPSRLCEFVYLDDIIDALLEAADPALAGQTVEIGAPPAISIAELARHLEALAGGPGRVQFAEPDRLESSQPAAPLPRPAAWRWQPRTPLAEGLRRTAVHYGVNV